MNLSRRKVMLSLGSAALALAADPLLAQKKSPEEGFEYKVLDPALPPDIPFKIEVLEFFWYGCPHCYAFEPIIEPWIKTLPSDVVFRRVPAVFYEAWVVHARLYYTLEVLGITERLHGAVFNAVHEQSKPLSNEAEIGAFLEANGVSHKAFADAWNSFTVQSRLKRSERLQSAYKIDGVPAMGVDGLYTTANTMMIDGRHESVPAVVDYLIGEARKLRKTAKA
jgi:protein dithiol oxidoreductase (disulfide-forming)